MVIRSEAHGGLTSSAVAYDLKPAWRTVAEVTIEERTFEHGGCADGFMIDVPGVRAEIKFEGGASWSAYSSDDPAYWHKDGSARRITGATRGFLIQSEEAADARDEVRRAIARRFSGAWLEGEEPTAPARPLKAAEVASAPPVRVVLTRSQLYPEVARPGPAWQWCYAYAIDGAPAITYGTGLASCRDMLRQKYRGRVVEFVEAWKAQVPRIEVATPDAQEGRRKRPGGPLPVNLYPGDCRDCGKPVGAGEGERLRVGGRWAVQHRDGECPA
jgi:hypothetical protein